jgi:exosortase/archaeosortase family protein
MGERRASTRFVATFLVSGACLLALYYYPYREGGAANRALNAYLHGYASSAGALLGWIDPSVAVAGADIVGRTSLRIVRTCDAMDATLLLVAAVLSWPSPWRWRVVAAVVSAASLYVVNVVRICSLYCLRLYAPSAFELAHVDVWPVVILGVAVGLFLAATRATPSRPIEAFA